MKAYKFQSSSRIAFALDIIFNRQLFCADWSRLNDPMEGMFEYSYSSTKGKDSKEQVEQIIREKKRLKVCSLSQTFHSHLLWAHYASGFDGVAVEVDIPEQASEVKIVSYGGLFASVLMDAVTEPSKTARQILSSKYREWDYEQEVRILHAEDFYQLSGPVTRVIAGHRMQGLRRCTYSVRDGSWLQDLAGLRAAFWTAERGTKFRFAGAIRLSKSPGCMRPKSYDEFAAS